MEVNHAIKEIGLSFNIDAVLAVPTKTSEVRLFELGNGSMSQARLAKEVWDYERYAGCRVWEGARSTIGGTYPFWQCHRYTRSKTFPRLHVVLAGKAEHLLDNRRQALAAAVHGITIAVRVNTLPRLERGEPWYEIGVDGPDRRRARYPEAVGR
ncbi:replication-relaxation family protein [Streptomyces sp. NRRL F-2580]|uniref:replication-relaxation family protein n=1 Tax=Streptomyces sp. NRRL F-2580 TaxID=1463841 RepID=UPI001F4810F1